MSTNPKATDQQCSMLITQYLLDFFERMSKEDINPNTNKVANGNFLDASEFKMSDSIEVEIYTCFIKDNKTDKLFPLSEVKDADKCPFMFAPYTINNAKSGELLAYETAYKKISGVASRDTTGTVAKNFNEISKKLRTRMAEAKDISKPDEFDQIGGDLKVFKSYVDANLSEITATIEAAANRFGFDATDGYTPSGSGTPVADGPYKSTKDDLLTKIQEVAAVDYFQDGETFGKIK